MEKKIINGGTYCTLVSQLDKLARHNRQGSFRTKERYYEAFKRFCAYLADEFHLQKLENVSGRHLTCYVLHMQENGKSASTIKTDLAAIRFFHDKMSRPKYRLPTNEELAVELERRCFGSVDRTWSTAEFNRMLGKALAEDRYDFILLYFQPVGSAKKYQQIMHLGILAIAGDDILSPQTEVPFSYPCGTVRSMQCGASPLCAFIVEPDAGLSADFEAGYDV